MKIPDLICRQLMAGTPQQPVWNQEYRRTGRQNKWNYIDGCMLSAFLSLYEVIGDQRFLAYTADFMEQYVRPDGSVTAYPLDEYNLDHLNLAKVLLRLYALTKAAKWRTAADWIADRQLEQQPRTADGSFWHKAIYPHQVWLDGLYMAMPFAAAQAALHSNAVRQQDVLAQFAAARLRLRDDKTGLYVHGYDETCTACWADRQTGRSAAVWLRAEGWLAAALADTWAQLPDASLATMLKTLLTAVRPYRHRSGLYCQVLDQPDLPGNYPETSGSALLAYAMLKGARLGMLPPIWQQEGSSTFHSIVEWQVSPDRTRLSGICLVAGLGGQQQRDGTPAYYLQEPVVENDAKGIAPMLMAYAELLRIRHDEPTR